MSDKYEKFKELTTDHLECRIKHDIESNLSNIVVENYIIENKNMIKKFAATKKYKERLGDVVGVIQYMLGESNIRDVERDVIIKALRKIGIYSNDRKIMCTYLISCVLVYMLALLLIHLGAISGKLTTADYIGFVFMSLLIAPLPSAIICAILSDTKFRLFRVK